VIGVSTLFDKNLRGRIEAMGSEERSRFYARYDRNEPLVINIRKGFHENIISSRTKLANLTTYNFSPLGEGLDWAGQRLAMRKEQKKIIFCISDGTPLACSLPFLMQDQDIMLNSRRSTSHAKRVCRNLERSGIRVVGIGLDRDLDNIFGRELRVNRDDSLVDVLSDNIAKLIKDQFNPKLKRDFDEEKHPEIEDVEDLGITILR
jgi:hypothetical protein